MAFFDISGLSRTLTNETQNETKEDILHHLQEVQRQMELVRHYGRRQQSRKVRTKLGTRANFTRQPSFNSTASYTSEIRTPETVPSVELSSRDFTVSFSEQQNVVAGGDTTCEISSHNFSRSLALQRSRIAQHDSSYRCLDNCKAQMEQSMEVRSVNEISDIEHTSQMGLHYQASSSQISDGPLNSSIMYPNNSTPRKATSSTHRANLSDCVKELAFDSDNSLGSPTGTISCIPNVSPPGSRDSSISGSSTCRPRSVGQESPSSSPGTYTATFTTCTTSSSTDTFSFPGSDSTCDPSSFDIMSCTADSDATAFLDQPLNPQPVTAKGSKSSKYRKMAKQLRNIGRQIQKGSKNLNLKTLAVV